MAPVLLLMPCLCVVGNLFEVMFVDSLCGDGITPQVK